MNKIIKFKILKYLGYSCFLFPGSVSIGNGRKFWRRVLNPFWVLSVATFLFVVLGTFSETFGHKILPSTDETIATLKQIEHTPVRAIWFCLKPAKNNESVTLFIDESKGSALLDFIAKDSLSANSTSRYQTFAQPNDLEDYVASAYRIVVFVSNILIRLIFLCCYKSALELTASVFEAHCGSYSTENSTIQETTVISYTTWVSVCQRFSPVEKCFLVVILISQLLREADFFLQFYTSIGNVGMTGLDVPCVIFQVLLEQIKIFLANELVVEIAAFLLLVTMTAFVKVLHVIISNEQVESCNTKTRKIDVLPTQLNDVNDFVHQEIDKEFKGFCMLNNKVIFMHTAKALKKFQYAANGSMDQAEFKRIPQNTKFLDRKRTMELFSHSEDKIKSKSEGDILSRIELLFEAYMELMRVWEQASLFMGMITLVLIFELTITFCLSTYITIEISLENGIFSSFGLTGVIRGILTVTKFIFVCNAAQELTGMTFVLLEYILELKLRLLTSEIEDDDSMDRFLRNGWMSTPQCRKCRGLGSLLTEMVSYVREHPFELSAMGYFTVSRSTLTTVTGVIVTYLVVLVQFQSYFSAG